MEFRNYLVDPKYFSPNVSACLSQVFVSEADFRTNVINMNIPNFLAQVLVVANLLFNDTVEEIASELKIQIPKWCIQALEQSLKSKKNLIQHLVDILEDMYNTKYLPFSLNENFTLFYEDGVKKAVSIPFKLSVLDTVWEDERRKKWIVKINKFYTQRKQLPNLFLSHEDENNNLEEWLQQQSFYDLRNILCEMESSQQTSTNNYEIFQKGVNLSQENFEPGFQLFQHIYKLHNNKNFQKDMVELSHALEPKIFIGSIPNKNEDILPKTFYIGQSLLNNEFILPETPLDFKMVRKLLKKNFMIVFNGHEGIIQINDDRSNHQEWITNQINLLKGLKSLKIKKIKWRNWKNEIINDSPQSILSQIE